MNEDFMDGTAITVYIILKGGDGGSGLVWIDVGDRRPVANGDMAHWGER